MQAYTERLTGGLNGIRATAAWLARAAQMYWRWITGYLDPMGAAYGTAMGVASVLFVLYCLLS